MLAIDMKDREMQQSLLRSDVPGAENAQRESTLLT